MFILLEIIVNYVENEVVLENAYFRQEKSRNYMF